ncbi:MAG: hypothetical protein ABIT08_00905 [Bacteroidia bacterium]
MKASELNQINNKLKSIPDTFVNDIMEFLEFLSFRANAKDWAEHLTAKDSQRIKRGADDLKKGRTYTHERAMKKINAQVEKIK